jgi:hypothetical protein
VQASKNQGVSKEILSKIWMVSDELAQGAINHNTQLCKHHADNSMSRHFTTNDRMLRYKQLKSVFFTDTLVSLSTKSTGGNSYAQVFVSDKGYTVVYPMQSQSNFKDTLHLFCKGWCSYYIGNGCTQGSAEQCNSSILPSSCYHLEEVTPWANRAELYIGLLKEAVRQDLQQSNAPIVLWDFCLERRANIHNAIPCPLFQNNGASPHEATQGENLMSAKVMGQSKNEHGVTIGANDKNPLLNTMLYDVEFLDGEVREYSANVIAENIYARSDIDGYSSYNILDGIVDYKGVSFEKIIPV